MLFIGGTLHLQIYGRDLKFSLVAGDGFKKGSLSLILDIVCGYFGIKTFFFSYSHVLNFL